MDVAVRSVLKRFDASCFGHPKLLKEYVMSKKVSPIPKGYRTVTPVIVVRGIKDAIEFYRGCFGAEPSNEILSPDELTVVAVTL